MVAGSTLDTVSPFFIVGNLVEAVDFYTSKLGFVTEWLVPQEGPFFAILRRDAVRTLLKKIGPNIQPVPNHRLHELASWDALVMCPDPDALSAEFAARNVRFYEPLDDTDDGLSAFEIKDNDGYVLCFARDL